MFSQFSQFCIFFSGLKKTINPKPDSGNSTSHGSHLGRDFASRQQKLTQLHIFILIIFWFDSSPFFSINNSIHKIYHEKTIRTNLKIPQITGTYFNIKRKIASTQQNNSINDSIFIIFWFDSIQIPRTLMRTWNNTLINKNFRTNKYSIFL